MVEPALLQQGRDPAWGGVLGVNALVEMGNLEKAWVISCLSLPSHFGVVIPGIGMGEEKQGPYSALKFMCHKGSSTVGKVSGDGFGAEVVVVGAPSVAAVAGW